MNLLNRRDCETAAATAAVDAASACVSADGDAAAGDGKSFDPAAVAPFSTSSSTQHSKGCVFSARFTLDKKLTFNLHKNCNRLHLKVANLLFAHFSFIYIASAKRRYSVIKNNNSKQNTRNYAISFENCVKCDDLAASFTKFVCIPPPDGASKLLVLADYRQ